MTRTQNRRARRKAAQARRAGKPRTERHHYMPSVACPACGTDATVGCFSIPDTATLPMERS